MKAINTKSAPAAIGPYSQGVVANGFLFTAGQIPLIPESMTLLDGSIEEQTSQVLTNLDAVLAAADTDWSRVVKTTVFLAEMSDFEAMNRIYAEHLGTAKPARSTVQVAALPKGAKVEIEVIAKIQADL